MGAPNLAWGGHKNGQIPTTALVDLGGGKLLQADAATMWGKFAAAFRVRWGDRLYLAAYQDAYRDLARQQAMYDRYIRTGLPRNGVAKPGNSIHGWARSVDCSGYGAAGSARHAWMVQNGARYGWSWAYGDELNESWHWDYVGPITTTAGGGTVPIVETNPWEGDMPLVLRSEGRGEWLVKGRGDASHMNPEEAAQVATLELPRKDCGANDRAFDLIFAVFTTSDIPTDTATVDQVVAAVEAALEKKGVPTPAEYAAAAAVELAKRLGNG